MGKKNVAEPRKNAVNRVYLVYFYFYTTIWYTSYKTLWTKINVGLNCQWELSYHQPAGREDQLEALLSDDGRLL